MGIAFEVSNMIARAAVAVLILASGNAQALEMDAWDLSIKTCGARQGDVWNVWSAGFVGEWVSFPVSGEYEFEVFAAGMPAKGIHPRMSLRIDLIPAGEADADTAEVKGHAFKARAEAGVRMVTVHFLNDYYDGTEDRNLLVAKISVRGLKEGQNPAKSAQPDWRKAADAGIEKHRKGDLVIKVAGMDGKPLKGAKVKVSMQRHAFPFGCTAANALVDGSMKAADLENYRRIFCEFFNCAVHENALKWHNTNAEGPKADFSAADAILDFMDGKGIGMRGHCIVWEQEGCIPAWARALPDDKLRKAVLDRIEEVIKRYGLRITEFDLDNEMIHVDYLARRLGEDFRVEMFKKAESVNPKVRMYVNDFNILTYADLDPYADHIEQLRRKGAAIGGIGCQGHFSGRTPPPILVRMGLDRLGRFGVPIKITEFDIENGDEVLHGLDTADFLRICFSHPAVEGILLWGFWEGSHWRPSAALYARDWREKPAGAAYRSLVLNEWRTEVEGTADDSGEFRTRAFFGTYTAAAEIGGLKAETGIEFTKAQSGKAVALALK